MRDFILGIALIAVLGFVWNFLGRSRLGRIAQAVAASVGYLAWLSIIPVIVYFVVSGVLQMANEGRVGAAIFVSLVSLTLIPILIFPLIPWNYYCLFVWRKTGVKLPQSERLAGRRDYYEWEIEG